MLNSPVWRGAPLYAFGLGLIVGGVVTSFVVMVLGSLVRWAVPVTALIALSVAWFAVIAVRELGWVSFGLPQNARLVPESVFRHGRFFGPFEFGFEMGTGVRTYVTSGLPYVAVLVVACFASPLAAVLAGVGFGLGRTLMTMANLRFSADGEWDRVFDAQATAIRALLLASFAGSLALIGWAALAA